MPATYHIFVDGNPVPVLSTSTHTPMPNDSLPPMQSFPEVEAEMKAHERNRIRQKMEGVRFDPNTPPERQVLVSYDPSCKAFIVRHGETLQHEYPIESTRIPSYHALCQWIFHLTEKGWFTREHVRQLIKEVCKHRQWYIWSKSF